MRKIFILMLTLLLTKLAFTQVEFPNSTDEHQTSGYIVKNNNVHSSSAIDILLRQHIELNRQHKKIQGYRIQIFFNSSADAKNRAQDIRQEFLNLYGHSAYLTYNAPNFIVRVGDFRTKNEALKLYNEIKNKYLSAFIVPDEINFPALKPVAYYE